MQIENIIIEKNNLTKETKTQILRAVVTKSNELARSEISKVNSVLFGRLFNIFLSKINKEDADFKDYNIPMTVLMSEKNRGGLYYDIINKQSDKWLEVVAKIKINNDEIIKYPLFSKLKINKRTNIITINIHRDLKPHLLQLREHFTQYPIQEYLRLSTVKTQRLFELLSSWQSCLCFKIDIEKLQDFLNCETYHRKNFKFFRTRILEPAHREITQHTSLRYDWETEKHGRKVIAIKFTFKLPILEEYNIKNI